MYLLRNAGIWTFGRFDDLEGRETIPPQLGARWGVLRGIGRRRGRLHAGKTTRDSKRREDRAERARERGLSDAQQGVVRRRWRRSSGSCKWRPFRSQVARQRVEPRPVSVIGHCRTFTLRPNRRGLQVGQKLRLAALLHCPKNRYRSSRTESPPLSLRCGESPRRCRARSHPIL